MAQQPKYYLVEATALPEIFLKVAEAKRMLQTGEVSTVHDAAKMMDISRSAFYKYRDSIFPFQNMMAGRIITFQMILRDMPGLLSSILTIFAHHQPDDSDQRLRQRDDLLRDDGSALPGGGAAAKDQRAARRRPGGYSGGLA